MSEATVRISDMTRAEIGRILSAVSVHCLSDSMPYLLTYLILCT